MRVLTASGLAQIWGNLLEVLRDVPQDIKLIIPGTNPYRINLCKRIIAGVQRDMVVFEGLHSLSSASKQELKYAIRQHLRVKQFAEIIESRITNIILFVYVVLSFVALFGGSTFIAFVFHASNSSSNYPPKTANVIPFVEALGFIAIFTLLILTPILITLSIQSIPYYKPIHEIGVSLVIIYFALDYYVYIQTLNIFDFIPNYVLFTAISSVACYLVVVFLFSRLLNFSYYAADKILQVYYPVSFISIRLIRILIRTEKKPHMWTDIKYKNKTVQDIEDIANTFQYRIPERFVKSDNTTFLWIQNVSSEIGNSIRSLSKWILMPKLDTRQKFMERIAHTLFHVVNGSWDELDRSTVEKLSNPQRWRLFLQNTLRLLRVLVAGLVPIAVLWGVQQTRLALSGTILDYLTIGAYLWAALMVLAALDPLYAEKISTIKTITDFLPLPGKNQKP